MMLSAVIFPVFGFSLGTLAMEKLNSALSETTVMVCKLRVTPGSAQIWIVVRSGPMPARLSAAATLTLAGKPFTASRALPSNTLSGALRSLTLMLFFTRCGAPSSPLGGLRVTMVTEWIKPSAAACTASSPSSAPLGTTICAPCFAARSFTSGWASRAPTLITTSVRPFFSAGSAICRNTSAGAHSTTMSACSASSASGTTGTGCR